MIENKQRKTKYVISAVVFSVVGVLMALYAVTLIIPIIWGLISSVKDTYDYTLHPFSLPDIWFFENYASAWNGLSVQPGNLKPGTGKPVCICGMTFILTNRYQRRAQRRI